MPDADDRVRRHLWDLAVVGAGPAGAAAALAARRARPDARVLLVDRSEFPRDKACGDGVAPHVLDELADLGVTGLLDDAVPVRALRLGFAGGPSVARPMRRAAYVVPRTVLDARVRAAALDAGARPCTARVRGYRDEGATVTLDTTAGPVRARAVVAADGAGSVLRRAVLAAAPRAAGGARPGAALALRGYAPVPAGAAHEQVIVFARGRWPAYAWSFPIGDGRANVGYGEVLPRAPGPGRGTGTLARRHLLDRLDALLPGAAAGGTAWRGHHLPLATAVPAQPDGRVLLAGDAAALVNPMTGEGIWYAVASGRLAGTAAVASGGDPGRAYRTALRRRLVRHVRHTALAATLARAPRVVDAALAAARRNADVFDDLVEVGLADGLLTARVVAGLARGLVRGASLR